MVGRRGVVWAASGIGCAMMVYVTEPAATPDRPRRARAPWDAFRWVGVGLALVTLPAVIVAMALFRNSLETSEAWNPLPLVWGLGVLGVIAGLISGSRFVGLYAGYAERLDPTAQLLEEDAAAGSASISRVMGDLLWSALIAGVAAAIPVTYGLTPALGVGVVILFPVMVLVTGLTWSTGWFAGVVVGLLMGTAVGIAVGASRRRTQRLPWLLAAALLPALLVGVTLPAVGVQADAGNPSVMRSMAAVLFGLPEGMHWVLAQPLLWLAQVALWVGLILAVALVVIGTPALIGRLAQRGEGRVEGRG